MFDLRPIPVPDLSGRRVFVTGAGRGIGAALVRVLVDRGARVVAGVHDQVETLPAGAEVVPLDVTDNGSVQAAVARLRETLGGLDVLVNNAGLISTIGPLTELSADELRPAFEVNAIGLHRVTMACLPLLEESRGLILNAGTGAATKAMEGWTAYCTSKAAARMLTLMQDLELSPRGVHARFVGIPPTDTAMQAEIREAGLNPISKIPQTDLVRTEVPASVLAWLAAAENRTREEVLLDVRDELFKGMMQAA
ncbi:SDR family NAD(P)-dependent oxidoreductase [Rubellimicrobium rubrum]|uniref:SDR family NAD(P)-dependent oxidoreductase n=1 Tax=Rubellimicrobium rubrum TaxID=2585369 RepID=A0A5C4N2H2_9RHOB|nr:SDR family NAD(P)-dependent oxidoreductase [Rubellimicrobium rubrum]TNC52439.1 SDR family NAD(P)-dependent oxidoreductase [Rubellimicrobium rubrum]